MSTRPPLDSPREYGNRASWWVEYPSGLVDLSRSHHLPGNNTTITPPPLATGQIDIQVDGGQAARINAASTAYIIIDMQNFFLHPEIRSHPAGLACINPLLDTIPIVRSWGTKVLWVNWGLTDHELETIPPALARGFSRRGGFGSELPGGFGRLLMRGAKNSGLYGPLQDEYERGANAGTDFWIHKNRMSGLWGYQSALDLFLKENGIQTLFFAGVNTDQCVLGTLADAYFRGYDCILVEDATATTSPQGGHDNVVYNAGKSYGFVTDSKKVATSISAK